MGIQLLQVIEDPGHQIRPWKIQPVSHKEARLIRSQATSGESIPPTPIRGNDGPAVALKRRITSSARWHKGAPLRPPASSANVRPVCATTRCSIPNRSRLVFTAMTPASPSS